MPNRYKGLDSCLYMVDRAVLPKLINLLLQLLFLNDRLAIFELSLQLDDSPFTGVKLTPPSLNFAVLSRKMLYNLVLLRNTTSKASNKGCRHLQLHAVQ